MIVQGDAVAEHVHGLRLALNEAVSSSEMNVSSQVIHDRMPSIVSWSVIVTKSIPRLLARS